MENKSRIFIGIPVPENIKESLTDLYLSPVNFRLDKSCKPVRKENIHITLHFLGDVDNTRLDTLLNNCDKYNFGSSFKLKTEKCGCFPDLKNPRVFFSKIIYENDLKILYDNLSDILTNHNFTIEKRKYKPHLTLAYIKMAGSQETEFLKNYIFNCKNSNLIFDVKSFNIYSSILKHHGAEHMVLKSIQLS